VSSRVLSALALLPVVVGVVWWLPPWGTLALAFLVVVLATREYLLLAERGTTRLPRILVHTAAAVVYLAVARMHGEHVEVALLAAVIALGGAEVGRGRPENDVARRLAVSLLPLVYIALPLGVIASTRDRWGAGALLALLLTVMASDVAQYYGGRLLGRRSLAPIISPKKTVEGAVSGLAAGLIVLPVLGRWWLSEQPPWTLGVLGATVAASGIAGDLLESLLKRSAGVKDASELIPGHGGMLDRIDSLLFAGPVYYMYLRFAGQ
jgi:phosphatidate cytidylyltransferase